MKKLLPDCYWPGTRNGSYVSHEAICVLNDSDEEARVEITLYFEDREPVGGFCVNVGAKRTSHIRMDKLKSASGMTVPQDTPYAAVIECNIDVAVQYTRVDATQSELALMTAMV